MVGFVVMLPRRNDEYIDQAMSKAEEEQYNEG
jgi:hypothetical protein